MRLSLEWGHERKCLGATTLEEHRKYIEKDAALERRFQPVLVAEPTQPQAIEILRGLRDTYEAHHRVKITDAALTAAVELSDRYVADLPARQGDRRPRRGGGDGPARRADPARADGAARGAAREAGAPLRRLIQREIETEVSSLLLDGAVREGDKVRVDVAEDRFTFTTARGAAGAAAEAPRAEA